MSNRRNWRAWTASLAVLGMAVVLIGGCQKGGRQTAFATLEAEEPAPAGNMVEYTLAYPTGERASSTILLTKTAPREVLAGKRYEHTIRVQNLTDEPLAGVTVSEQLGSGLTFVSATPEPQQLSEQAAAAQPVAQLPQGEAGGPALRWDLGEIGPRQTRLIRVTAEPGATGTVQACLTVHYQPTLCAMTEVVKPELTVELSQAQDQVYLCEPAAYRAVVRNVGTGTARDVVLNIDLPEGLTTAEGQPSARVRFGDLAEGEQKAARLHLQADRPGMYNVQASATSEVSQAQSETLATAFVQPALRIEVGSPEWVYVDRPVTFDITVTNTSDVTARNTVVRLDSPWVPADRQRLQLGTIPGGQSEQISVTFQPRGIEREQDLELTAVAESYCTGPAIATVVAQIRTAPALLLETVDVRDPVPVGEGTAYSITVKNQGSAPAPDVQVTAQMPREMEFIGADGSTPVRAEGQQLIFGSIAQLPPGQTAHWQVRVRANQPGVVNFRTSLSSPLLAQAVPDVEPTHIIGEGEMGYAVGATGGAQTQPAPRQGGPDRQQQYDLDSAPEQP